MGADGLCECGCGEAAPIAKRTLAKQGMVKGEPQRYVLGHNRRRGVPDYVEEDRGHSTPCWIWQRYIGPRGYGTVSRKGHTYSAHRFYYVQHKGPVPDRYVIDHRCKVPACVNPDHLEAVTHEENLRRAHAKLDALQVERILTETETSARELARQFGVSHMSVLRIRQLEREKITGRRI
jgi:hypothetical protein